ncbi:hypothetical protein H0H92_004311 [Tricholoma furcatifolium]|nr:hypothetical protein H0H92_004311 [Tricholoma furcatifolium]
MQPAQRKRPPAKKRHIDFDDVQNGTTAPRPNLNQNSSPVDIPTAHGRAPWSGPFDNSYPPPMNGWRNPYAGPHTSTVFGPYPPPPPHVYYGDIYPPQATRTFSNSNSTSSSLSDDTQAFVTEDPNYSEHYHQYQSRLHIIDERPLVHVPPFYRPPPGPHNGPALSLDTSYFAPASAGVYGYGQPISPAAEVQNKTRNKRADSRTNMQLLKFKSTSIVLLCLRVVDALAEGRASLAKPCRFYMLDGACPNGSKCTFIHDGDSPTSPQTERLLPTPPVSLPTKPLSTTEENKKKNFYPVSWRVIGGGVLMGSEQKSPVEPSSSDDAPTREPEITSEHVKPESTSEGGPPLKPIKRTRSSSIPGPTLSHVYTGALFSAESPE